MAAPGERGRGRRLIYTRRPGRNENGYHNQMMEPNGYPQAYGSVPQQHNYGSVPPQPNYPMNMSARPPLLLNPIVAQCGYGAPPMVHQHLQRNPLLDHPALKRIQPAIPYNLSSFPTDVGKTINIDNTYTLEIANNAKPPSLYLRVLCLATDTALCALLAEDAQPDCIQDAVRELVRHLDMRKFGNLGEQVSSFSVPLLEKHFITPMMAPNSSFPDAVYHCNLCKYHLNSITHAREHFLSSAHLDDEVKAAGRELLVQELHKVQKKQIKAITRALNEALDANFPKESIQSRVHREHVEDLQQAIFFTFPEEHKVVLKLFGSVAYSCELPESDMNYLLDVEDIDVSDTLQTMTKIHEGICDFQEKNNLPNDAKLLLDVVPRIQFTFFENVKVVLHWRCQFNWLFGQLIKAYVDRFPMILKFMRTIRLWAKMSNITFNSATKLGLPGYGFDIMAIHFLQYKKVLPVFNELLDDASVFLTWDDFPASLDFDISKITQEMLYPYMKDDYETFAAELFLQFLAHYIVDRTNTVQMVSSASIPRNPRMGMKNVQIADPYRTGNVASFNKSFQVYFYNCFLSTFVYFATPRSGKGAAFDVNLYQKLSASPKKKKSKDKKKTPSTPSTAVRNITEPSPNPKTKETVAATEEHVYFVNHVTFVNSSIANDCGDVADRLNKMEITQETDTNESSVINDFNKHFPEISPTKPIGSPSTPNSKKRPRRGRKSKNLNNSTLENNQDSETTTTPSTSSELVLENGATEKDFEIPVVDIEIDDEAAFKYPRASIFAVRETVDEPSESQVKYFKQYGIYQPNKKEVVEENKENEEEWVQQDEIESFVDELTEKKSVEVEGESSVPPDFVLPELPPEPVFVPEVPSAEVSKDGDEEAEQLKTAMETREICFEEFFVVLPDIDEVKKHLHQVPTWQDDDFCYTFRDGNCFNHGCSPEVKCSFCEKITHVSEFCPQMVIPKCKPVTHEITPMELEELKLVIDYNYESNKVKPERRKRILHFISHVESILRIKLSDPSINLCVFGSVTNGFGNDRSDADVCLRFNTEEPPENVSAVKVIEEVFRVLRDLPRKHDIDHVQAITSAKVPIVKFFHRGSLRLEVDISYYNTLALYNTQLLYTYTQWAPKIVPQLGLFVKRWAKECEIGDASKGSLSSYSYIVMLINYLQSCDPPVLPRLQEDVINGVDPQEDPIIIDGWNVSFYNGKPIQNWSKNKKNVAEHFLGFLDFYAHFDFSSLVIQIRRKAQMPKIEKDWRKPICLEDPFDLNHNLGAGVSTRMAVHIQKCFVKSRDVFFSLEPRKTFTKGEDVEIVGRAIDLYKDYLLHACVFARPPIDRQCRHCFKVGHQADGCPLKYKKLKPRGGKPNR